MANIECDTQKIRSCGSDIMTLANDFHNIMQTIFETINGLNSKDEAWKGQDAEIYIQTVLKDREIYDTFYNQLKSFGSYYQISADILEDTIRKMNLNE